VASSGVMFVSSLMKIPMDRHTDITLQIICEKLLEYKFSRLCYKHKFGFSAPA
jgi:hypothetical protein